MARPHKPVDQHVTDGTYRSDRHGKRAKVEPMLHVPPVPSWINPRAATHWNDICNDLIRSGFMGDHYITSAALLCDARAAMVLADERLTKALETGDEEKIEKLQAAQSRMSKRVYELMREYGMSPNTIRNVQRAPDDTTPEDDMEAMLESD